MEYIFFHIFQAKLDRFKEHLKQEEMITATLNPVVKPGGRR
jgi:hypothetical protein